MILSPYQVVMNTFGSVEDVASILGYKSNKSVYRWKQRGGLIPSAALAKLLMYAEANDIVLDPRALILGVRDE